MIALNVFILGLGAMATIAGEAPSYTALRWSWWGLALIVGFGLIRGTRGFVGALLSVLVGSLVGCLARWTIGFEHDRATPRGLVVALTSIRVTPSTIIRAGAAIEAARYQAVDLALGDEEPTRTTAATSLSADPPNANIAPLGADDDLVKTAHRTSCARPARSAALPCMGPFQTRVLDECRRSRA